MIDYTAAAAVAGGPLGQVVLLVERRPRRGRRISPNRRSREPWRWRWRWRLEWWQLAAGGGEGHGSGIVVIEFT